MLSFNEGRPIALIQGGIYNKKKIKLSEERNLNDISGSDIDIMVNEFIKKNSIRIKALDLITLKNSIKNDKLPPDHLQDTYNMLVEYINKNSGKEIQINDGYIIPLPKKEGRDVIYISGPSGAGKTSWAASYIQEYNLMFPNRIVYVFSRLTEDPVLDQFIITRIVINEEIIEDPIIIEELLKQSPDGCLVLFDDIDTLPNKFKSVIYALRDDILEVGRHYNISIMVVTHQLMNYKETRTLITEATDIVFFPQSGMTYHIKRFLKEYVGLSKQQIDSILKIPSRWIKINKTYPLYIMANDMVKILSD